MTSRVAPLSTISAAVLTLLLIGFWSAQISGAPFRSDDIATLRMGVNIAHHGIVSIDEVAPYAPSMYREPVPGFVTAAMVLLVDARYGAASTAEYMQGARARWIKHQNIAWLLLLCVSAAAAVAWLTQSAPLAMAAALIVQAPFFHPSVRDFGIDTLFSDIPAAAVLMLASLTYALAMTRRDWRLALCAGLLFGLLALIKAAMLYVFVGLVTASILYALVKRRTQAFRAEVGSIAVTLAAFTVLVAPWLYRNAVTFGTMSISDRGGLSLYTRALKDQISPLEYRGSFYVWTPSFLKPLVAPLTGFGPTDLGRGGRLERLYHPKAGTADYRAERAAERAGRSQDAVSFYFKARAERKRLSREYSALGNPHPWLAADRALTRAALDSIRGQPLRHLLLSVPMMWRGALVVFPILVVVLVLAIRRGADTLALLVLPAFGLIMFYALCANFEERYGIPALPIALTSGMIVLMMTLQSKFATLFWYLQRPRLLPQQVRDWQDKFFFSRAPQNRSRAEATQWCASIALDTTAALRRVTKKPSPPPIEERFRPVFAEAATRAAECPIRMGGPGNLDLLYALAEHVGARRIVETGVAYGWSSLALLLSASQRADGQLVSIDMPYPKLNNDEYVGCVVPQNLRARWTLLRYADREGLPRALRLLGSVDLCRYDSDKTYRGRMWAYPLLWNALRPGGLFISDDIGDNVAFRDFCQRLSLDPVVVRVDDKYVGVLVKPDSTPN